MAAGSDISGNVVMIDFPDPGRKIAAIPEHLRKGFHFWNMFTDIDRVSFDQVLVGIQTGHKRGPARSAKRKLAVSVGKADPSGGQAVDIW